MIQDTSDIQTPLSAEEIPQTGETIENTSGDSTDPTEIEKLQEEIAQLREQLARSQADYNNLVRRSREEQSQIGEWAENKTILKFLPILDNLERALEHTPEEFKGHAWLEGITSTIRAIQKILTDMGIVKIDTLGQEINPDLHDVISQIPHKETTVQAEVETGYIRGEKTLRHAKVIVGDGTGV